MSNELPFSMFKSRRDNVREEMIELFQYGQQRAGAECTFKGGTDQGDQVSVGIGCTACKSSTNSQSSKQARQERHKEMLKQ